ncbi:MAG: zinc ribbon domain-containing protein [Tepidimonas sp.]|uniref:FmdB family zinc ribbon protein n=1 Tax=Tepidimonas sp. TaxID=2002775 RepID=UPI00259DA29A|nr:FmdB family zinc ribbon protein [Tepidimonas sp.]MDM7457379.1 zinc ribbon domain-containing protein [Tepidimonas sp.]
MPIYAYKCESCGHARDVLQKVSDEPLSVCPVCGAATFRKQLTAAGFQLKGTGWYVTDFRNGAGSAASASTGAAATAGDDSGTRSGASSDSAAASTPCGAACACH